MLRTIATSCSPGTRTVRTLIRRSNTCRSRISAASGFGHRSADMPGCDPTAPDRMTSASRQASIVSGGRIEPARAHPVDPYGHGPVTLTGAPPDSSRRRNATGPSSTSGPMPSPGSSAIVLT